MRLLGPTLSLLVGLSGCKSGGVQKLDVSALLASGPRTVVFAQARPARFMTNPLSPVPANGAIAAGLGYYVGQAEAGEAVLKENGVVDPAIALGNQLVVRFAQHNSLQARPGTPASMDAELSDHSNGDLFLRVKTTAWSLTPLSEDARLYRVDYSAGLELYDARAKKLLVSRGCVAPGSAKGYGTRRDKLMADQAALLKQKLEKAAAHCGEFFATSVLGLPPEKPPTEAAPAEEADSPPPTEEADSPPPSSPAPAPTPP